MRVIYKYEVAGDVDWQTIILPVGFEIVEWDATVRQFWAIVDPEAERTEFQLQVVGTGWPLPDDAIHLHTSITPDRFVWHLLRREVAS